MKRLFCLIPCVLFLFSCKKDNNFNDDACEVCGQSSMQVFGSDTVTIYNVITPNGDGKNDMFRIIDISQHPGNSLVIYNRDGDELTRFSPYVNNWPLSFGSVNNGLYKFKLTINSITKEGSMLVLKSMDDYYNIKLSQTPCGKNCSLMYPHDPFLN